MAAFNCMFLLYRLQIKTIDKLSICDFVSALTHVISKMLYQSFCNTFGIIHHGF